MEVRKRHGGSTIRTVSITVILVVAFGLIGASFWKVHSEVGLGSFSSHGATSFAPTLAVTANHITGLVNPWDLAFLPDGTMFFTERCRGLSVFKTDRTMIRLFGTSGASVSAPDLFCEGQSGMNGVAVDPDFATNRYVYVFMSSNLSKNPRTNRVVRLVVSPDFSFISNRTDIVTDIAYKEVGNRWGGAGAHSGGRLRFGPDGFLYITTGDNHNGTLPQSLTRLGGKVLRVNRDGSAAAGNNPPTGADLRIFTYGHRNVQGIAFKPGTGQPFSCEHGPRHSDEITALVPGGNGGWDPAPETGVSCRDDYCGYTSNKSDGGPTPMTDLGKFPKAMPPVSNNKGRSQGTGPCTFLSGPKWKAWDGRLIVGIMGDQRVDVLSLDSKNKLLGIEQAEVPAARVRTLVQGPDGNLYAATDSGSIWRIRPQ